jgi:alanine dehydrogenase
MVDEVLHYCVTNMPGAVGRTSTFALCNVTLPWVLEIAQRGIENAARDLRPVARAINLYAGEVTNKAVAETLACRPTTLSVADKGGADRACHIFRLRR